MDKINYWIVTILLILTYSNLKGQVVITKLDTINLANDSLLLRLDEYRGEIKWQYSSDSVQWINLANENNDALLITNIDSHGLYRAEIIDGSCSPVYSDTASIQPSFCPNCTLPIVGSTQVNTITNNSVQYSGSVTSDGNTDISSKGIVWNTSINPTRDNNQGYTENGTGINDFSGKINNLEESKTYYLRAYVTNSKGTSYGDEIIFTTYKDPNGCTDDAECCNLLYSQLAIQNLDLSNPKYKQIHDFLYQVDRTNAYHVFTRKPEIFLMWCEMVDASDILSLITLDGATHETNHLVNYKLKRCNAFRNKEYLFLGNIYSTEINNNTSHISIVEETIPEILKTDSRYKPYIEDKKDFDNSLDVLLDELNSYTGGSHFTLQYLKSDFMPDITGTLTSDGELGGMVNFMAFLQYYLKSARLNHSEVYNGIKLQTQTMKYVQVLWDKAEEMLEMNYPYTTVSGTTSSYRLKINMDYLNLIYSDDVLQELDSIGINHKSRNYWNDTYFK